MSIKRKIINDETLLFVDSIVEKEASGLSKKSVQNYREVYERFRHEINDKLSKESINKWVQSLIKKGMNPISINYFITQIRVFAYWLIEND